LGVLRACIDVILFDGFQDDLLGIVGFGRMLSDLVMRGGCGVFGQTVGNSDRGRASRRQNPWTDKFCSIRHAEFKSLKVGVALICRA